MGGSLTELELLDVASRHNCNTIKNFVETGTYKADSTIIASRLYETVYTTEVYPPLYLESKLRARSEGITNINFYLGDSLEVLDIIMKEISWNNNGGSVFFLDAHISGSDSGWNGKIRVPLVEELKIILKYKLGPSVFIVDDVRLWKTIKAWDWVHITNESIVQLITDNGFNVIESYEKDDRFYVYTS